jgi:hypothetical protein
MLTFNECLSYCGLAENEIEGTLIHEKIPVLAAIAFVQNSLLSREGDHRLCESLVTEAH